MVRKTKEEAEQTRKQLVEAARRVFHQHGVSRSSLERIAREAGVTRGAVYWHFQDKAALFFAMREDVFVPLVQRTDEVLFSPGYENPLDAIEDSILEFFGILLRSQVVREVFEIMLSRCEYVDEFVPVREEVRRPAQIFLEKMRGVYAQAAERGYLAPGLSAETAALDTWAFTSGLIHLLIGCHSRDGELESRVPQMVAGHMALRRAHRVSGGS